MIGVCILLVILCTSVRSLPVTSGHLESEDVKVLKCIVEALADVLSKPRPLPVSQDCLLTLTTDDRLVAILRHQNFLKELQEIALEGGQMKAQEVAPLQETRRADDNPDRSMLESLGGPGERSMLSQERSGAAGERRGGHEEVQDKRDDPQQEQADRTWAEESENRGRKEKKGSDHSEKRDSTRTASTLEKREESLHSLKQEKREDERGDVKRGDDKRGDDKQGDEERDEKRGDEKRGDEKRGDEERDEKRGDEKRGDEKRSGLKLWSKRAKSSQKKADAEETEKRAEETEKRVSEEVEIPHHSKEETNQEVETAERRSPEEEELQLIARTATEEEGSGNKKEAEIESLATIESELESVAQKLHALSRADRGQQRT